MSNCACQSPTFFLCSLNSIQKKKNVLKVEDSFTDLDQSNVQARLSRLERDYERLNWKKGRLSKSSTMDGQWIGERYAAICSSLYARVASRCDTLRWDRWLGQSRNITKGDSNGFLIATQRHATLRKAACQPWAGVATSL